MYELLTLNFSKIGEWVIVNELIDYQVEDDDHLNIPNSLYAFVVNDSSTSRLAYIGKTTQTLGRRFYGYHRGNGKSTNNKVHNKIKEELNLSKSVEIWAFPDKSPLSWGKHNINLAAGLEDSLIMDLQPLWNGNKSESEQHEVELLNLDEYIQYKDCSETIIIAKTYWDHGYVNVSAANSPRLGAHGEHIVVLLGKGDMSITSRINRNATQNSVRLQSNLGPIREYYQRNYEIGDMAQLYILGTNLVRIV